MLHKTSERLLKIRWTTRADGSINILETIQITPSLPEERFPGHDEPWKPESVTMHSQEEIQEMRVRGAGSIQGWKREWGENRILRQRLSRFRENG
jgi:hypothetical protein